MEQQDELPGTPTSWTHQDSQEYLAMNPLPADFTWAHRDGGERPVVPIYRIHGGYGKWLRETPYFPGLFELIHDVLFHAAGQGFVPDLAAIVAQLNQIRAERQGQQNLF